jgi:hypothetical protein
MSNEWHFQKSKPTKTDDLVNQRWQPMSTVPLGELVICLWGHRTIGSQIYDSQHDVKYATAKYWIPMPKLPDNERHA